MSRTAVRRKTGMPGKPTTAYERYKVKMAAIQRKHVDTLDGKSEREMISPSVEAPPAVELGLVKLTDEIIESGKSARGGWSERQLQLIGVEWPPVKGWKKTAVGRRIVASAVNQFILLRGK